MVSFRGSFCKTCGVYDYFEDFVYDLLDVASIETRIVSAEERQTDERFEVLYEILDLRSRPLKEEIEKCERKNTVRQPSAVRNS
jgi:hypothetical protein